MSLSHRQETGNGHQSTCSAQGLRRNALPLWRGQTLHLTLLGGEGCYYGQQTQPLPPFYVSISGWNGHLRGQRNEESYPLVDVVLRVEGQKAKLTNKNPTC